MRPASCDAPETLPCRIRGESSGQIGQQDLRFVRRGVSYCSAVARGFPRATVALLGRFLPRLGPLPQGERPLSFLVCGFVRRRFVAGTIPPPPCRAATPPTGSRQGDRKAVRTRPPNARTRRIVHNVARPYTAPG